MRLLKDDSCVCVCVCVCLCVLVCACSCVCVHHMNTVNIFELDCKCVWSEQTHHWKLFGCSTCAPINYLYPVTMDPQTLSWSRLLLILALLNWPAPSQSAFKLATDALVLTFARLCALSTFTALPLVRADTCAPALLAFASLPLVLTDACSPALFALAPLPLVLTNARAPALFA